MATHSQFYEPCRMKASIWRLPPHLTMWASNTTHTTTRCPTRSICSGSRSTGKSYTVSLSRAGRFALNIAPTSIKDFRPIHYHMTRDLVNCGFIMRTEILWYKQTMRRRTAWGSWKSPRNPHMVPSWEYVLVFSKGSWTLEGNKADADITSEEFIKYSDAFWQILPETRGRQPFLKSLYPPRWGRKTPEQKANGHPAPFPEELIKRLIKFYTLPGQCSSRPVRWHWHRGHSG